MSDQNNSIRIEIKGLAEIENKLKAIGRKLSDYTARGAQQASDKIVSRTVGLQKYPPESEANKPPTPYYKRNVGMQYKTHNDGRSEKLDKNWHVNKYQGGAKIYNNVSYAKYVHGDEQPAFHAARGWLKLKETFQDNIDVIRKAIEAWVNKALTDTRLK